MSKVVVSSIVSVDGYTEGPGGNVMAMPMDHAFDEHNAERMRAAGSLLLGGTTYRGFVGFWPGMVDNPDATPGSRVVAQRYADGIPITVVSDTLTEAETGPWRDQTTIVRRADAHEAVARLREQDGGDALMFGSRTALDRPAGPRPGRRAAPDGRSVPGRRGRPRVRGCPRDRAAAAGRPPLGRLGQRAAQLRDRLIQ